MFIVDSHLDLAYNAVGYGRNLQQPIAQLRADDHKNGNTVLGTATVTLPEMRRAGIGLTFASLFVLPAKAQRKITPNRHVYKTIAQAHAMGMEQLDYYHRLADESDDVRLIGNLTDLENLIAAYSTPPDSPSPSPILPLGLIPLMEGADSIREPAELEMWVERGLRVIGPAWDDTRYACGAWRGGDGFTDDGFHLMELMAEHNLILDITHLSEKASLQALERYEGPIAATHCNARTLVPGERQLNDTQIRLLGERNGMIGTVWLNIFLRADHAMGDRKDLVTLDHVIAHIDHICQVLGDATHVGIGSDLDGGFGREDTPAEFDTIYDLNLIVPKLRERGYGEPDITNIMGGNWLNFLRRVWG